MSDNKQPSLEELAAQQGVEPYDPATFKPLDLTEAEADAFLAALADTGECRCGHPYGSHNTDGSCAWSWEDSDGFGYACDCGEYASGPIARGS